MGLFDEVNKKFGKWIQVLDYKNESITVENFDYGMGVHGLFTEKHCDNHGVKIDLYLTLPGAGIKIGKSYPVKSAFMIFPNGKLKCNTILGGRQ